MTQSVRTNQTLDERTDARATHFLVALLVGGLLIGRLFQDRPWDKPMMLGGALATIFLCMAFLSHRIWVAGFPMVVGVIAVEIPLFTNDPLVQQIVWSVYALEIAVLVMLIIWNSPAIPNEAPSAIAATVLGIAATALLSSIGMPLWIALSIASPMGAILFLAFTHRM